MKISILLPYKENFSSTYAGAVSLFVKDTVILSKYKKSTVVVKVQRNSGGDKFLNEARKFRNITLLPMKSSKRIMIDALMNGEVLALASDQNAGNKGIKVPFFGFKASIPNSSGSTFKAYNFFA